MGHISFSVLCFTWELYSHCNEVCYINVRHSAVLLSLVMHINNCNANVFLTCCSVFVALSIKWYENFAAL